MADAICLLDRCFADYNIRANFRFVEEEGLPIRWEYGLREQRPEAHGGRDPCVVDLVRTSSHRSSEGYSWVTAEVSLERDRSATEHPSWKPRRFLHKMVFRTWPLGFEQAKYIYERGLERRRPWLKRFGPPEQRPSLSSPGRTKVTRGSRVLLVAMYWLNPGGAEAFALWCVKAAAALGLKVIVLLDAPSARSPGLAQSENVTWIRSDVFCDQDLYTDLVLSLIRENDVVGIHIHHSHRMYRSLAAISALPRRPYIVDTLHIIEYEDGGYPAHSRALTDLIDGHHVVSRHLARYFQTKAVPGKPGKVHLGYLFPVDLPRGEPVFSILETKNTVKIGFVGRFVHQKRPFLFLEAARRLLEKLRGTGVRVSFDMIGDGPLLVEAKRLCGQFGLDSCVRFAGFREDITGLMSDLDVLLITSANEGLTLIAYEAFAAGTLVFSSDVGAQSELVPAGALLDASPMTFASQAATAIARSVLDKPYAAALVRDFRRRLEDIKSSPHGSRFVEDLYRELLRSNAAAS